MPLENDAQKTFLLELYRSTGGDADSQQSMYAVGEKIGLDKASAKKTAEDLIGLGLMEIRTLSGAVGITGEGINTAIQEGAGPGDEGGLRLGADPLVDDRTRQALEALIETLRKKIARRHETFADIEEMVIDIKTMEVHLLSARAKTAVIREVLRALQTSFAGAGDRETAGMIERIIR